MNRLNTIAYVLALFLSAAPLEADNPTVVSMTPDDGQDDVDPALSEIRVQFDQEMSPHSWSIVGGGPMFPEIVDRPRWEDAKTIVIAVKLQPDHEYQMSINSDTFTGFRNRSGEPALPQPLSFRTRRAGHTAEPVESLSPEINRAAIQALRKTIDANYSYRDRLKIDWDQMIAAQTPAMTAAKTPNQFARAVAKLLRAAQDAHVHVRAGDRTIGTHVNPNPPNFNLQTLRRVVPEWKVHQGGVVTGKYSDEIGYLLVPGWIRGQTMGLDDAFATVNDTKGLVIDVRMNGGGNEDLASHFAGRFINQPTIYSRHRTRCNGQWLGPFDRVVNPRAVGERYPGPIAVLIGPKVASSCESFVLMIKQGARCTLVGDMTKGSSGNPRHYDLGNGVTVILSSWEDQLPDGTILEGRGVTPDILVRTTLVELRERDMVLQAALRVVRTDPAMQ